MTDIQTAIAIDESLYQEINLLPKTLKISPSELFTLAMREYLQQHNRELILQNLDEAYADGLDKSEKFMLEKMRHHQRQLQEKSKLGRKSKGFPVYQNAASISWR
jgi:metal-responsive CopG/Arc/MetJ family transcriptional regulator